MTSLEKVSGLPLAIGDDYHLKFNQPIKEVKPTVRTFREMKHVMLDPTAHQDHKEVYYMYRNVHFPDHDKTIEDMGLSYDITVIPPYMLGQEYNKTLGHYHANQEGSILAYPEIYEILHGSALFVLQKMDQKFKNLVRVLTIEAKEGDKVIYPPNYGHIIINHTDDVLVTANWVANDFKRMYKEVEDFKGLAYYVVRGASGKPEYVPNPNYKEHPPIMELTRKYMTDFQIMQPGPMYLIGTNNPKTLEFLTNPQKYAVELSSITS